jgi:asparagine synthase (glutamine-hydrolysing)
VTNLSLQDLPRPLDSLLDGWVDFAQWHNEAPPHFSDKALATGRLDATCLALSFDPRAVACGMRGPLLIASIGGPRFAGQEQAATEAQILDGWAAAYGCDQAHAARRVAGDYAVFIVDFRARRAVLACDRFVRRTLCYAIDGTRLSFADRADAVARRRGSDYDQQALYNYLWFHFIPAPQTVFQGVQRLPGGHTAALEGSHLSVQKHWLPAFEEHRRASYRALRAEFRELLHQAMARQAHGKVGCFLSGGTDSSTVAGMLANVTGRSPPTFSIGFDAAGYDEMDYARTAAHHFKTDHHEYYVTPDDVADAVPKLAGAADQPFGNSSLVPAYYCARMARDSGIGTMLAGDGGDELFGGNTRYAFQRVLDVYERIPRVVRRHVLEGAWNDSAVLARIPVLRKAASYVKQARIPMPDRLQSYNLLARIGMEEIFTADFLAAVDPSQPLRDQRAVYRETEGKALVNRMLAYDWKYTLADSDLPKVNLATSTAGVACAFPLLDDRLVDFSLRLAPSLKLRRLTLRWFFKDALKDFLPREIIAKRKHGFGLPFGVWITRHARLRDTALESIDLLRGTNIVRPDFLARLTSDLLPRAPGYYGELVWILMMLGQWRGQRGIGQGIARAAAGADIDRRPADCAPT